MGNQATEQTMMEAALSYAQSGLPVIPLHSVLEDGTCTCGQVGCSSPGKHPRTPNGLKDATTDTKQIENWWGPKRWPNASIGGVGGAFFCLDIDAKSGGHESLEKLVKANTKLPDTAVAETGDYSGERGLHYWFRTPPGYEPGTRAGVRPGIDIRCHRGYGVLPPSPHHTGVNYEWVSDIALEDAADVPEWLLDLVPENVSGESKWAPDPNFKMSKQIKKFLTGDLEPGIGEQRQFLTQAARSVLTTGRSIEHTTLWLWEGESGVGGIDNCEQDDEQGYWTEEQVYELVRDIYLKPPTSPMEKDFSKEDGHALTDFGNAERIITSFPEGEVRYIPETESWLIWDHERGRFIPEGESYMRGRHNVIQEELEEYASNLPNEDAAQAFRRWSFKSRMKPKADAAVALARDLAIAPESSMDADPYILSVGNGAIDLRTGEFYDATPRDLLLKHSNVDFDPDARSALFEKFLKESVPDRETREFLQRACGYSLTGSIAEHKFFYIYGRPATGKSTFMSAFMQVLGTYAKTADTTTFTRGSNGRGPGTASEDLARLAGARMVVTQEVEENERFASALVAQYTGGDPVAARFLHGSTFEFHPKFKLWIAANHRAKVSGARSGIWRRMMVIPMDEVVPPAKRDPRLPEKLREPEALSAILAWAVRGAVAWFESRERGDSMLPPKAIEKEGEDYQRESDHLYAFIEEAIKKTGNTDDRVPKMEMFTSYLAWCDKEGRDRRMTKHVLSRKLTDFGFESKNALHDGKVKNCWMEVQVESSGITIKGATAR